MSVVVNAARLRHEMTRRGWDALHLSREPRLSAATVSAALAAPPIAAKSLSLIADALSHTPADDVIDSLLLNAPPGLGLG